MLTRYTRVLIVISVAALGVAITLGFALNVSTTTTTNLPGMYFVTDFGAVGDGVHDDTAAFQAAIEAAAKDGGMVIVPLVGPGRGYVLTGTVTVKRGIALIGSLAGFTNNGGGLYTLPDTIVKGPKIFARPSQLRKPLFQMEDGSTVKGFWILYDQQPWPSDEEFQDPKSPYYYPSFEDAKAKFIKDHVKAYGPTFYLPFGGDNHVEDIMADRYYDFFFLRAGAMITVNRIRLYGYNRAFVIRESYDVNRISNVGYVPNVGPVSPGRGLYCPNPYNRQQGCVEKTYSWIYGIIVSQPSNVGVHIGKSDAYSLHELFFYGIHTAIRFGASKDYPIYDPVEGTTWTNEQITQPGQTPGSATGPWGQMSNIEIDQCVMGLHFVWPSVLSNRISNLLVHTALNDRNAFPTSSGTGNLQHVSKQAVFLFEPTFRKSNNLNNTPTVMASNVTVASFRSPERFSLAAADAFTANGRVFLVGGDTTLEIFGFLMHSQYDESLMVAAASTAGEVSIKIRGFVYNGKPDTDKKVDKNGVTPLF